MKKLWAVIKHIIDRNQKLDIQNRFKIGDNLITSDKNIICNRFNNFFVNIGPTLAKSIPKVNESPPSYMGNRLIESIYLEPVTENEINTLIKALKDAATWIPYPWRYLLKLWTSHWPISAICLLPREFSLVNWKLQMSSPCTKVMILCCLIITDLFLYCVFSQRFLKKIMYNIYTFQPSSKFLWYYMKVNMAFEKIIYPFGIAFIYR